MAAKEVELLGEAIAGTENEIFQEAMTDTEVEDTGDDAEPDRSLEAMEEVDETDADAEGEDAGEDEDDAETKADADDTRDKDTGRFKAKDEKSDTEEQPEGRGARRGDPSVPLKAERQQRQVLEQELAKERQERAAERETLQTRFAQLEGRLDQVLRQAQAPKAEQQQDAQKANTPPDKFVEPEAYDKWVLDQIAAARSAGVSEARDTIINLSMANAKETHGDKFDAAYKALTSLDPQNGAHRSIVNNIRTSPNPGAQLMRWHRQQQTLERAGEDLDGFVQSEVQKALEAKMKDPEFLKQVMADAQSQARGGTQQNGGRPNNLIRKPPSLNGASGRGDSQIDPRTFDNSERAVFDFAIES